MTVIAGQTITDLVTLRDSGGSLVTGATWTVLFSAVQGGDAVATQVTETASPGTYLVETETTVVGDHHRILSATKDSFTQGWYKTEHVVSGASPFEALLNRTYSEVVYVTDAAGAGLANIIWTTQHAFDPDGDSFALSVMPIDEVDGGYVASVTPDLVGAWGAELVTNTDPVQRFVFSVDVATGGTISALTIVQGQAYTAAAGTALTWTDAGWPTLDEVLVTVTISPGHSQRVYDATTIDDSLVSLDLPASDTALLEVGRSYSYELRGEFDRSRTRSLLVGVMTVVAP